MSVRSLTKQIIKDMLQRQINAGAGRRKKSGGLPVGGLGIGGRKKKKSGGLPVGGLRIGGKTKKTKSKAKGKKPRKGIVPPALRAWHSHLSKVRRANPNLTMAQAMVKAKKTY